MTVPITSEPRVASTSVERPPIRNGCVHQVAQGLSDWRFESVLIEHLGHPNHEEVFLGINPEDCIGSATPRVLADAADLPPRLPSATPTKRTQEHTFIHSVSQNLQNAECKATQVRAYTR